MKTTQERFEEKFRVNEAGCWIWTGAVGGSRSPRPQMRYKGKTIYATRVAWELFIGPLSHYYNLCHSCDEALCVNPAHLFPGTQVENMQDASRKRRLARMT